MSKLLTHHRPAHWLKLFYALALLLPLTGRAQVVISQAYGGGGNSGSVYKNDFIELFNRGTTAVNVTGWTVQYASTTGTFTTANSTTLSGTIQPGKYYLIQEAAGSGGTTNLPTPDATGTIAMGGTGFRVALVNNTSLATATTGPNSTFSANVVDFLGSGSATAYEGASAAPAPSNSNANLRANGGCTDTNVNGNDFTAAAAAPRNSATTANPCATPAEINVTDGTVTYLTGSTYSGFATTTVGSVDTKTFTIENTGGTALTVSSVAATGDFSVSGAPTSVAAGSSATFSVSFAPTAAGTRTGTLTITNSDADEGSYVIDLSAQGQASTANPEINLQQGGITFLTGSTYSGFANTATGASSAAVTFTIQNLSTTDALSISSVSTTGDFSVSGLATPATVPANGSVTVSVVFAPTAAGTRTGSLVVTSNDQDESTYTIALQGEGLNPAPAISSLAPASATAGDGAFTLTVNGSSFVSGAVVSFNGVDRATTFVSATQLTAAILASDVATAGTYNVVVTNPTPGGGASAAATFTVNPLPAPTLTSINPASIVAGQATTVTFTGTNFVNGATVSFNGATLTTTFVSSTTLTASITPPAQSATATYPVTVTTPSGVTAARTLTATGVFTLVPISLAAVNTPVTEDFNSLAASGTGAKTTLPTGFDFFEAGGDTNYSAGTGSSNAGDTYSFGSTAVPTDRALGTVLSGSVTSRFGAQYVNNTGQTITSLGVSYTGEEWRLGTAGRTDQLDFQYSTTATGVNAGTYVDFNTLDFVTPNTATTGAKDGNAAANRTAVSGIITGLSIAPGATFFIRWLDADASGADDGLAVDDLSVTANPVLAACSAPDTPTFTNIAQTTADVTVTPGPNGSGPYTVTATPTAGGAPITASGASPVTLTGLTAGTSYSVTATSTCNAGFSSPSATSAAATLTTTAAPTATLAVTQNGTAYPSNGAAYAFGNQTLATTSAPVAFTLTNSGTGVLTISSITATGDFAVSGTAPATVAAGSTATVSVTFTPTVLGTRTGTLVIVSDASTGATYTVNLTGNGTAVPAPEIDVQQASTSYASGSTFSGFPSTTVGSFSPVAFTVLNTGSAPLTISSVVPSGDFSVGSSGAAPYVVQAGGSLALSFIFGPTAPGTRTGSVTLVNDDADEASYVINLSGNATAAPLPDLTVSSGTPTSPTPIAGNYNNVTIAAGGNAIVAGPLTVAGTLTVQPTGLLIQNCQPITGAGNFVLQSGAGLAICDAAGIYTTGALGAIRLSGTRTYSPGAAYIYNGTVAQVTGPGLPAQVSALGVTNAGGLSLSQAVAVAQQVTLQLGNLNTNGQSFTLLSSAAGTAVLDNGTLGSVVNGTATVQRYINSANAIGYRHYSAPVSNTTVNDLAAPGFSPTFNTAYNTSPTPSTVTQFPTVFGYDQSRVSTVTSNYVGFDKGWFSPAAGDAMAVNRGYTVNAPNTALIDFVGTLNNGSQNSGTLAYTGADGGWQFLGNPYPAPLDWSTVGTAQRPGMDAAMYVFQSSGQYGGSYRSYANGVGASSLIPTASGYFVRVATQGSTGAVNLTNANRVATYGPQPAFGRGTVDVRPQVHLQLSGASTGLDEAYVYFEAGATAGRDAEFDATKLANPSGLNLASVANGQEMAINGLPLPGSAAVIVPLAVQVPQAGSYRFAAANVANFTGTVTLVDALTGTRTALSTGSSYAFTLAATTAPGRFSLEFRAAGVLATTPAQALAAQTQLFPNPASTSFRLQLPVLSSKAAVSATLVNALGQTVLTRKLSAPAGQGISEEFDVRGLAAGVYTLRLSIDGTPVVRKVVVE
ncbi:choice-of-anchor D domain-containing protein [Hymenobacter sp. 5317J-9]|uniref:choice-of-anchor D domain-containing protein n=1 Tax=Hymenobacter sp. 5317J-9 TaxID=2932250 RepID=UPI001FD6EA03|nr:choice-of-anchor D domain-containing protein [Hymenobacter sp. 5317J-9]UOQ96963.1 choice-of-anchor D domain-containing protein [Hymenobacter sp. 5317J-9]